MPITAPTYQNTRLGWLWMDPIAPVVVQEAETVVFQMDRYSDIPVDRFTSDSIFKYYSTDAQVNTQYIHLKFDLQAGWTGSDWTSIQGFAREIGKDTLPISREVPRPTGVEGSFRFPIFGDATHYRVVMKTFGGDSTGSFTMGVGLSEDRFYGNLTPAGS